MVFRKQHFFIIGLIISLVFLSFVFLSEAFVFSAIPLCPSPICTNRTQEGITVKERLGSRSTLVHVPPSGENGTKLPIVIALHGVRLSGKIAEAFTGLDRVSNTQHFLVAYPNALHQQWNDGRALADNPSAHVDDTAFMSHVIDLLCKKYHGDRKRVYLVGYSSGGMFAMRMALEMSDKVTAVAAVAATLPTPQLLKHEHPSRPVPLLLINGDQDPVFPWQGGNTQIVGVHVGPVSSVLETVQEWVQDNGGLVGPIQHQCLSPGPPRKMRIDSERNIIKYLVKSKLEKFSDATTVSITRFPTLQNTQVLLYRIHRGGHTWPGANVPLFYIPLLGRQSQHLNASELIWAFFSQY